jgi:DNA-binding NtrC family response regulator
MVMPRIVILDAEPVVRSVVTAILERDGYTVEQASTLGAALEVVNKKPPDLVLTNVYLPGVTGHDAMEMIKKACPNIPVLMVSGLPDSEVIEEWVGRTGFDTFPKPFAAQDLLDKVHSILGKPVDGEGKS